MPKKGARTGRARTSWPDERARTRRRMTGELFGLLVFVIVYLFSQLFHLVEIVEEATTKSRKQEKRFGVRMCRTRG